MRLSFQRTSTKKLCPVCGKGKGCLIAPDGGAAICVRVASGRQAGNAGWLHRLGSAKPTFIPKRYTISASTLDGNCYHEEADRLHAWALNHHRLDELAERLGVSEESLRRLRVGYCEKESCWTFPLSDAQGKVVGINRRFRNGEKKIVKGHKAGLYLPADLPASLKGETLLIVEGGSDTAAALDLGFHAVGRFSCSHGAKLLVELIHQRHPKDVVIVADTDEVGRRGAESLASVLVAFGATLKVIEPKAKDLREWLAGGATHADVVALIEASPVRHVTVKARIA